MKKIHIRRFSKGSIIIAAILVVLLTFVSVYGIRNFHNLEKATEQYLTCEQSAQKLQKGSDTLTEQVRLYVMTGQLTYMEAYFEEANVTRNREQAIEELERYFSGTQILSKLEDALDDSKALMQREFYAMKLAAEGFGEPAQHLNIDVTRTKLTAEDQTLSSQQKLAKARRMTSDDIYQDAKQKISENVNLCMGELVEVTRTQQHQAASIFEIVYIMQEFGILLLLIFLITAGLILRMQVVNPLVSFNKHIAKDEAIPPCGAAELQTLAETYNQVLEENRETQKIIRHEAEHDALTDLLNRGSFDKILPMYNKGSMPFALILADIDNFKIFNDTYGHAVGDDVIRETAKQLKVSFRNTDYVFRIGGDEFAVIMVDVTEKLRETVQTKLNILKENLARIEGEFPPITMSVGVAFSDRPNPGESIFNDADEMLYYVKEHEKNGSRLF